MVEENNFSLSQESLSSSQESLLLSQGTFQYIWNETMQDYNGIQGEDFKLLAPEPVDTSNQDLVHETVPISKVDFTIPESSQSYANCSYQRGPSRLVLNSNDMEIIHCDSTTAASANETSMSSANLHTIPSSLPASEDWPGDFNFNVSFGPVENNTKGVNWTYSLLKSKLYVRKDVPCPISFSINTKSYNMSIRAMALFTSPEHSSDVVHRCTKHSVEEIDKGVIAQHLIRCECAGATYDVDKNTERHSVTIPFENPPAGQIFSSYIFKFTCFGSCSGGPNRRPLMLIFSLEKDGQVVGRKRIDLKICACPGRDCKTEESQTRNSLNKVATITKKEPNMDLVNLPDALNSTKSVSFPPAKKLRTEPNSNEYYTINVSDPKCYQFLKQMKRFYTICESLKHIPSHLKNALIQYGQKTSSDSDTS